MSYNNYTNANCMNNVMLDYATKLRIIGRLKQGQRLDTTNGLNVYEDSLISWILRKYYKDNKNETVRVLQDLYNAIDQSVNQFVQNICCPQNDHDKQRKIEILISMARNIRASILGLSVLMDTYSNYANIASKIEGIVKDIALVTYREILQVIEHSNTLNDLYADIVFNGSIIFHSDRFIERKHSPKLCSINHGVGLGIGSGIGLGDKPDKPDKPDLQDMPMLKLSGSPVESFDSGVFNHSDRSV